jgi:hypothetical protein
LPCWREKAVAGESAAGDRRSPDEVTRNRILVQSPEALYGLDKSA